MQKALGLALLVAGVILLVYGLNASESFGSEVSRFFSGAPTDKTIWLVAGGAVCLVAGLGFVSYSWRNRGPS